MDHDEERIIREVCEKISGNLDTAGLIEDLIIEACQSVDRLEGASEAEVDKEEIISILHYAYWAIRRRSINPTSAPYQMDFFWERLKEVVDPIVESEMEAKNQRYLSLLRRGFDTKHAELMSWHRMVNGSNVSIIPDEVLLSIPGIGHGTLGYIRKIAPYSKIKSILRSIG